MSGGPPADLRIATCRLLPEPDPDEDSLLAALADAGVTARMAAWNDPTEDWDAPVPTLIRSTWDYIHDPSGFLAWVDRAAAAAPMWNAPGVLRDNVHKRYLLALASAGIPTTPTQIVPVGDSVSLSDVCSDRGWADVVIKPAVGAASYGTRRFTPDEAAAGQHHLDALGAGVDVLIQPYLASVDGSGERALVWIDGELTHSVRKTPRFSDGDEHVSGAIAIAPDERELAHAVIAQVAEDLLYARVDIARDDDGAPLVMELELIEPSLFLLQHPPATARLVDALVRRLRGDAA